MSLAESCLTSSGILSHWHSERHLSISVSSREPPFLVAMAGAGPAAPRKAGTGEGRGRGSCGTVAAGAFSVAERAGLRPRNGNRRGAEHGSLQRHLPAARRMRREGEGVGGAKEEVRHPALFGGKGERFGLFRSHSALLLELRPPQFMGKGG